MMARTTNSDNSSLEMRSLSIFGVRGFEGRCNDVLLKPALPRCDADPAIEQQTLVFFGGDIQNFLHLMDHENPNILCRRWCLEAVANQLSVDFPQHHIVVIKPSRIMFEDVSCYDNFVAGNFLGVPTHTYLYRGVPHLQKLLQNISRSVRNTTPEQFLKCLLKREEEEDTVATENTPDLTMDENPSEIVWQYELMTKTRRRLIAKWQRRLQLDKYPLTLVAFSKGCVVLNQFLYEFHYAKSLEPSKQDSSFIDRIKAMYWLDGGHPGRRNVYLSARGLLKTLTDLGIEVHCHVSPYQTQDLARPWINKQWKEFIHMLKSLNAKIINHRHVTHVIDLRSHFNLLLSFKYVELCNTGQDIPPLSPRAVSAPAPGPAYSPTPSARTSEFSSAPPVQTPTVGPRPRTDVIGLALVSSQTSPYLGLQMILREPPNALRRVTSSRSESSTSPQIPSASAAPTSASAQSSSDSAQNPSSSDLQAPGSVHFYSTVAPDPANQNLFPSAPPYSCTARRYYRQPPASINDFTVLYSKPSNKINFNEDHEAAESYESARYYCLESPVVAIPSENSPSRNLNIYSPVEETYVPMVMNSDRLDANVNDSANTEAPQAREVTFSPRNFRATPTTPEVQAARVAWAANTVPRTVQRTRNPQVAPRASNSQRTRAGQTSTSQGTQTAGTILRAVRGASPSLVIRRSRGRGQTASSSQGTQRGQTATQGTQRGQTASSSQGTQRGQTASSSQGNQRGQTASSSQGTETAEAILRAAQEASPPLAVRRSRRLRNQDEQTPR